jgi:hypothetical protein
MWQGLLEKHLYCQKISEKVCSLDFPWLYIADGALQFSTGHRVTLRFTFKKPRVSNFAKKLFPQTVNISSAH